MTVPQEKISNIELSSTEYKILKFVENKECSIFDIIDYMGNIQNYSYSTSLLFFSQNAYFECFDLNGEIERPVIYSYLDSLKNLPPWFRRKLNSVISSFGNLKITLSRNSFKAIEDYEDRKQLRDLEVLSLKAKQNANKISWINTGVQVVLSLLGGGLGGSIVYIIINSG